MNQQMAQTTFNKGLDLYMLTPANTGILYNGFNITYLAYFNNDQITISYSDMIKPGAYLINEMNPIGHPLIAFIRFDVASQSAWLQVTPEPLFPDGVLYTVPLNKDFNGIFTITTETNATGLAGIIYIQTNNYLIAHNLHEGDFLWESTLPGQIVDRYSPIIATKVGVNPMPTKYFLYVLTQNGGQVSLLNMACCSGNGQCTQADSQCLCATNYYPKTKDSNCATFCNLTACQSCSASGVCTCHPNMYGTNCQTFCTAALCSNKGVCGNDGRCVCASSAALEFTIYAGANCEIHQTNWFLVGCIIAGGVVVLLAIILGVLAINRKPSEKRTRKKNKYDIINN